MRFILLIPALFGLTAIARGPCRGLAPGQSVACCSCGGGQGAGYCPLINSYYDDCPCVACAPNCDSCGVWPKHKNGGPPN
ncbi:unnamed protein product [Cercospora beticola]|nr:unnamed protein product [Cercospora beticola]